MQAEIVLVPPANETVEDMPLNDSDRAWIRQEIRESHKRQGFAAITGFMKDWGGIFAAGGLIIFVLGQWSGYVDFRSNTRDRLDTLEQKDIPGLNKRLDKIEVNLQNLSDTVNTIRLNQLSSTPNDPQSSNQITHLLIDAKAKHINIDATAIKTNGAKFIAAAQRSPQAWDAAMSFVNYRSFLNIASLPNFPNAKSLNPDEAPNIDPNFKPLPPPPLHSVPPGTKIWEFQLWAHGAGVPPDKAALLERISKPRISGGSFEVYIFNGEGGTLILDDQRMRNVIVQNCVIEYSGGQTILENVYFVNCIFRIRYTQNGTHLGDNLLASSSTNFKSSS